MTIGFRLECRGYLAFVDELYIRPAKRREGIGSATLAFLKEFCHAAGICQLQLEVKKDNSGAIAFYQKLGLKSQDRQLLTHKIVVEKQIIF